MSTNPLYSQPTIAATRGPAYLDSIEGIAHKDSRCPDFINALSASKAIDGPMTGFIWCAKCGAKSFVESEEWK